MQSDKRHFTELKTNSTMKSLQKNPEPSLHYRQGSDVETNDMRLRGSFLNTWCFGVNSSLKRVINIHHDKALASRSKGSNTIES